mmetsp:Transcript_4576/g.4341  ORF Transcript_4576/g.4341 Transcript_4576/m.4341 type:complete len:178 (-) Transcript_4576:57-590(-)
MNWALSLLFIGLVGCSIVDHRYSCGVDGFSPIVVSTRSPLLTHSHSHCNTNNNNNNNMYKETTRATTRRTGGIFMVDQNDIVELTDDDDDDELDDAKNVDEAVSVLSTTTTNTAVAPFLSQGGELAEGVLSPDLSDPKQTRVILYIILSLIPVLFLVPLMLGSRDLIPLDVITTLQI